MERDEKNDSRDLSLPKSTQSEPCRIAALNQECAVATSASYKWHSQSGLASRNTQRILMGSSWVVPWRFTTCVVSHVRCGASQPGVWHAEPLEVSASE